MKKTVWISAMGVMAALGATAAQAQETGRVISSTPVIQQVAVPRQVCSQQPVAVEQPATGGGAVIGAIVGGLLGHTVGGGMGRAVATGAGVVAGAAVGDNLERRGQVPAQAVAQQCATQTFYENRTMGYNVVYEYNGKQYTVQMPYDPGPTIRLQVSPMSSYEGAPATNGSTAAPAAPGAQGVILAEAPGTAVYPSYVYPAYAYYPAPYYRAYPPVNFSIGLGYVWHGGGHRHWH